MTSTTAVFGKILIIDDDEKLNRLLTDYLSKMGFTVLTATLPSWIGKAGRRNSGFGYFGCNASGNGRL